MHMDECLSSLLFSEKFEMEGGKKLPYTIINDLSGDRNCSATEHNNQSALKITSKYSLLASMSLGAILSPLWELVRNVPVNLGWIILGQSCQNIGDAQWKEHSCRLTFLDSGICICEETKGPIWILRQGMRTKYCLLEYRLYSMHFPRCFSCVYSLNLLQWLWKNGCVSPIYQNKKL